MRRGAPLLVAFAVTLLLAWYVVYTQRVVRDLRREASRSGQMYARVYRALGDPNEDANAALLDLSRHIREMGVPVIVTDARGRPAAAANLPFDEPLESPRVAAYVGVLDEQNMPVVEPGVGVVHYGNTPLVRGLRVIPLVQAGMLGLVLLFGAYAFRARGRAEREMVWAGMARESAHQLGTPLSSLAGWLELLDERGGDPMTDRALAHMRGDLERLDRVARRFERIGRPPKREPVDVGGLADRVAAYFRSRVPTLAHTILITADRDEEGTTIQADPVLIEWALESLVKNAIDALAGRGGRIGIAVRSMPEGGVRLRVADDGPGIPRELRARVFEPGFSTKDAGWGIGLSLAKRIVEENHGGRLSLLPTDQGAAFEIILP